MRMLIRETLKPLYRFIKSPAEREFIKHHERAIKAGRYKHRKINFLNYNFIVVDYLSFVYQFKEIFADEIYKINSDQEKPCIIDCGANIGTSCLYFKKSFPLSRIIAFEADPKIFEILKQNLLLNNIRDIELHNKAVWIHNKGLSFNVEGADGGSIHGSGASKINIGSVRFREILIQEPHIDLLKIDIEGAEVELLEDCRDAIAHIKNIFIEYHGYSGETQKLDTLLAILTANKFRYHIHSHLNRKHPFINKGKELTMDVQLNIFAYKL